MNRTLKVLLLAGTATTFLAVATPSRGQTQPGTAPTTHPATPPAGVDPATHAAHIAQGTGAQAQPAAPAADNAELVKQLAELRTQITQLQAAIAQGHAAGGAPQPMPQGGMKQGMPMGKSSMQGMGMSRMGSGSMPQGNSGMSGMSGGGSGMQGMSGGGGSGGMSGAMMDDDMMMGGMPAGGGGGGMMGMMDQMMSMGMSRMGGGMNAGSMSSALPGFPGASHIYHLGATGFFLDHGSHITLTVDQQKQLGEIKEQSLLNQATLQRKVDQAEQELWDLTGAEAPDAAKIEAKAREIEQARTEQRVSFIRDVGKAAVVLTDEQRRQLTGMAPPSPAPANQPGAMPGMGGGAGGGMSDM
ncbi:MAG: Spy/CpxP family protein refolding chaperone [Phycisphaerales bacterium]